jgi:hypothetical protein
VKQSSQIAPPQDGVHFTDILPDAPPDATCLLHILDGKPIAGVWVVKEHAAAPELLEGAWVWWDCRHDATSRPDPAAAPDRPRPRLLELL